MHNNNYDDDDGRMVHYIQWLVSHTKLFILFLYYYYYYYYFYYYVAVNQTSIFVTLVVLCAPRHSTRINVQ